MPTSESRKEAQHRFRLKHPDRVREWQKAWRLANPDKEKSKRDRHQAKHRDKIIAKRRDKGQETRAKSKSYMQDYLRNYYVANADELRAKSREYYRNNRDKVLAQMRRFKATHRELVLTRGLADRMAHPDRLKNWAKANKDKIKAIKGRRRARQMNAPVNDFTAGQWGAMKKRFEYRCAYCNKPCKGALTQDHIMPLSKGGSHTASNIVPACLKCNMRKHTGPPLRPVQPLLLV